MRKLLAIPILTLTLLTPTTAQAHPNPHDHPSAHNALKPLSQPSRATQTPKPTPRPTKPIPSDLTKRCPRWHNKFVEHGLPVKVFSYIAWRESRCRPNAINARYNSRGEVIWTLNRDGSIDRGLIQVNSTWVTVTSQVCKTPRGQMDILFDVDCNLAVARYLYDNGGLAHWGMWPSTTRRHKCPTIDEPLSIRRKHGTEQIQNRLDNRPRCDRLGVRPAAIS